MNHLKSWHELLEIMAWFWPIHGMNQRTSWHDSEIIMWW